MTSEVEKLYENARIKKEVIPCPAKYYGYDCTRNNWDDEDCSCDIEGYPPFTPEKQIELIKWLGELDMLEIMRTTREDKAWIIISEYGMSGNVYKHTSRTKSFEESLASLTNSLWQDLTEDEKQQIRGILE